MSHLSFGFGTALFLALPAQVLAQAKPPAAPPVAASTPANAAAPPEAVPARVDARSSDRTPAPAPEPPLRASPLVGQASDSRASAPQAAAGSPSDQDADDGPPVLLGKKVVIGAYGSLDVAYTRMFGEDGALVGLEGALLLNHRFSLGLAGYAWTNPRPAPPDLDGSERKFDVACLGGTLRYSFFSDFPAYVTVGALIAGGAIIVGPRDRNRPGDRGADRTQADRFLVVQPDLTVHVNIIRWLRLGATFGYRLTAGVGDFGFSESDVNGVVAGGRVQIGRF